MSGGSFNYLCDQDIVTVPEDLHRMATELTNLGYANSAAARTLAVVELLDLSKEAADKDIRNVWHAVEWWRSNDWGESDVKAAIFDYDRKRALRA